MCSVGIIVYPYTAAFLEGSKFRFDLIWVDSFSGLVGDVTVLLLFLDCGQVWLFERCWWRNRGRYCDVITWMMFETYCAFFLQILLRYGRHPNIIELRDVSQLVLVSFPDPGFEEERIWCTCTSNSFWGTQGCHVIGMIMHRFGMAIHQLLSHTCNGWL